MLPNQEPVREDLEKTIDNYLATYFGGEKEKQEWPFLKKIAIYFANWQKQQEYTCYEEAFEDGAKWKAEQLNTLLGILKLSTPQIQLDWVDNQWRISLFDKDSHWKDEAFSENIIDALKELIEKDYE